MIIFSSPGGLLTRLLDHRGLGIRDLPGQAGIPESEARAVLDEAAAPDPSFLQKLASILGWHPEDLYVLADLPVPEHLMPLEPGMGRLVRDFVRNSLKLSAESRERLVESVRALPQQHRSQQPSPAPEAYRRFPPGLGSLLVRMLDNRNLDWLSATDLLYLAGGPILSGSMVGSVGLGRKRVTPQLLASFATVLGIPVGDLAAVGGVEVPADIAPRNPAATEMATLIWEARRLTSWQLRDATPRIH